MLIFSRYRAPWVGFVFILVLVVGSLMRYQTYIDTEKELIEKDQAGFVDFKADFSKLGGINEKLLNSKLLFEVYRCGVRSIEDKGYCSQLVDELYNQLTEGQREGMKQLVDKYFPK